MLAAKIAREAGKEQMRARVAAEVDQMFDNGVRINPVLRAMHGSQPQ